MEEPTGRTPVTIALVDDYDIVVMGIEHILEQYQDRVVIAELDTNVSVSGMVDIVLYDSFARPESPLRRHRAAGPPATWLLMSAVIDVRGGSEWPLRGFRSGRRSDLVVAIRSRLHRCQKSSGLTRKRRRLRCWPGVPVDWSGVERWFVDGSCP